MLAVSSYRQDYVAACRAGAESQLKALKKLRKAAPADVAAFAPGYFIVMVLGLDHFFLHRQRSQEGKDGGALNELRMLCDSIKEHDGVLTANATIKYKPEASRTGLKLGERIVLDEEMFGRLAEGVFTEIAKKYP